MTKACMIACGFMMMVLHVCKARLHTTLSQPSFYSFAVKMNPLSFQ